jgi:DNA modification methylase
MNPVGYLETGIIQCADNLAALSQMPDECIDLVYLDPPFFSNRKYEVIWGDEAEVRSFEDRWEGGINVYLDWMEGRLRQLHRVLKPTGSLYLHCDQAAGHHLKVALDRIFGQRHFRSEIVWRRTGSNKATHRFGPIHQTIFYYRKSTATPFYPVKGPYTAEYVDKQFRYCDDRGRYRHVLLTGPGRRSGDSGRKWRHYDPSVGGRHWQPASYLYEKYRELTGDDLGRYPLLDRLDKLDAIDLMHWPQRDNGVPNYKYYLDDAPGVAYQDIWAYQPGTQGTVYGRPDEAIDQDVKWLSPQDAERVGYPTQKPEGVLARIIRSSTREGDIVLDPFCGCGTTVAVAQKLGRHWIGIDVSTQAIEIMKLRLAKLGASPKIIGVPTSVDDLRELGHFEFQHWIIQRVMGSQSPRKVADMGIDGFSFLENAPIQVKQSERVGRPEIDKFETAVARNGSERGFVVAFSFTKGAYEEVARANRDSALEIVLVKVEDVVRVGALMDSADREGRQPDLSSVASDLMGLFSALETSVEERPFYPPPKKEARPSADDLIASLRKRKPHQLDLTS